jgi:NADH:ubiquinone oxidoreductase subunit 4 (subunit M)
MKVNSHCFAARGRVRKVTAFCEFAILPMYFLIAVWGSTRREYGAMKLALYSFVGSAMVLIGLIAACVLSGAQTFDFRALYAAGPPAGATPFRPPGSAPLTVALPAGLVIAFGCAPGWLLGKLSLVLNSSAFQL